MLRLLTLFICGFWCSVATNKRKHVMSPAQLAQFDRDGVIIVRGLLSGRELRNAQRSASRMLYRHERPSPIYRSISFQGWRKDRGLRRFALDSEVPKIAAQLMGLRRDQPMRVLQDALFALEQGDQSCGWHTDDKFFWPCSDNTKVGDRQAGVNVWVTLSPLRAVDGGGLAVAPGSHAAPWREAARRAITGTGSAGVPRTCELAALGPSYSARCDAAWRDVTAFDMEPGDALIHTRYAFHRGVPFKEGAPKLRYSVRYMPADAELTDLSGAGVRPLFKAGAYHPQVWPHALWRERLRLRFGLAKRLPRL